MEWSSTTVRDSTLLPVSESVPISTKSMHTRSIGHGIANLLVCFPLRFTTGSKPLANSILLAVGPDTPEPDIRAIFTPPRFSQKGLFFCETMAALAA